MNMEHTGSAIIQPNWWIKADEIITPTLPNVSASMCKKTPEENNDSNNGMW